MLEALAITAIILLLVVIGLLAALWLRPAAPGGAAPAGLAALSAGQERLERLLRDDLATARKESADQAREQRAELATRAQESQQSLSQSLTDAAARQAESLKAVTEQLARLAESNEKRLEAMRVTIEGRLTAIQSDNQQRLDQMRETVNEKLQSALERRLSESFKLVSERLEHVHKGLGEMQTLAAGVGDLRRVLQNVRTRGTWGEVQLGALLEQLMTPDQFARNVAPNPLTAERVEFAIRLPGPGDDAHSQVWLPIDAKFPREDYERLLDAVDRGDTAAVEAAGRSLEDTVTRFARDVRDKYVHPPDTTDFAVLFLPTEGLYAELLRRPGVTSRLQEMRVMVAGPTTLAALLSSLQVGFRTLAIQRRSAEVWRVLGEVKREFAKFGEALGRLHRRLLQASGEVQLVERRTRAMSRKLRQVQQLTPSGEASESDEPEPLPEGAPRDLDDTLFDRERA